MSGFANFVSSQASPLWLLVILPVVAGIACFALRKHPAAMRAVSIVYGIVQLVLAAGVYAGNVDFTLPMTGGGIELRFCVSGYQSLFILMTGIMFAILAVYTAGFVKDKAYAGRYTLYLDISLGMLNGAIMSDNLACMLFFWEGLLCTMFLTLLISNTERPATAVKALVVSGTADLLLMAGIIITGARFGTLTISELHSLPLDGSAGLGFALMFLGAVGKAGSMPFHSWIPNAAEDAPLPFMAAFPGALEKLLGIYFAARLVSDMFAVDPGSGLSTAVMILGVITIVLPVSMAMIQTDMKKLLAYDAISQVGYMVLGIGTCLPIGIVGGLFHMLNNAVYKTCLFMTAGAVEKRTGTTDAGKIGGLRHIMPVTAACFILSGLALSGVPPFNGFFSKELIFDAALESGTVFYVGALLGAVMTFISVLKIGHAVFFGKEKLPSGCGKKPEADSGMLISMSVLGLGNLLLGLLNALPTDRMFAVNLGYTDSFAGWPKSPVLVAISIAALLFALADHVYGAKKSGSAIAATDHISGLPGIKQIYSLAVKGVFDPYRWLCGIMNGFSWLCVQTEHGVSWFYDDFCVHFAKGTGNVLSRMDNGHLSRYIGMALIGVLCLAAVFLAAGI